MATPFFGRPILHSSYEFPAQHHALGSKGQPLDRQPAQGRRRSSLITPIPKSEKRRGRGEQTILGRHDGPASSSAMQPDGPRPFFCQVEAVETAIWLTEDAGRQRQYAHLLHIKGATEGANPGLPRLALEMATGAAKATVMAMRMAWRAIKAVRNHNAKRLPGTNR